MVKVRPRGKHWQYDILFRWPDGEKFRERAKAPVSGRTAAQRWAEARERTLLAGGKAALEPAPVVSNETTFGDFWPRVLRDHYRANRKKPSTIETADSLYRNHLRRFDGMSLSDITSSEIAALKGALSDWEPKTVNNILSVLSRALHCAVDWGVIPAMPCKIQLLPVQKKARPWYEVHDYRRLVEGARLCGFRILVLILLAGSAGLRRGEIQALKWTDLDLKRRLIHVQRAIWRGHEESPKGGKSRYVDMTPELAEALGKLRHLIGERVLYSRDEDRDHISNRTIRNWFGQAQRRAGLEQKHGVHMLRHTFCSHLAAAGAPAKAIQELAGHVDLVTTQQYMHLSPSDRSGAMSALTKYHGRAA